VILQAAAVLLLTLAPMAFGASQNTACLECHSDKGSTLQGSIHAGLNCQDCHATIRAFPHPEKVTPVDCATCHADASSAVSSSVHSHASQQPCLSCHGDAHAILPPGNPGSSVYPTNLPKTCGTCHQNAQLAKKYGLSQVYAMYIDSIHGFALTKEGLLVAASCSSCHGSHKILSSRNPESRTYRSNIPATCGTCHAGPEGEYLAGIHGTLLKAGNASVPVCTNCHTAHQIANVTTASWQLKTTATCGACHQQQYGTYRDTFHAQVAALGYVETAHCWDCHQAHAILPPSNPKSTVAKANLETTCGQCHSDVNASFVSYQPHADPHNRKAYPALWSARLFMNLLLASVLGFFAFHTILWLVRSLYDHRSHRPPSEAEQP
jgi:hypothetical protein